MFFLNVAGSGVSVSVMKTRLWIPSVWRASCSACRLMPEEEGGRGFSGEIVRRESRGVVELFGLGAP